MTHIVLASASVARRDMLRSAGLDFIIDPANIDEAALKQGETDGVTAAKLLAEHKSLSVSRRQTGKLVIGADQILVDRDILSKPRSIDEATQQLRRMRGKKHRLISAVACSRNQKLLWSHQQQAVMVMRDFSDAFLAQYMADMGESVLSSVGAYQIESRGVQLFSSIEGDFFTILGMPLIPLLDFLRQQELLMS